MKALKPCPFCGGKPEVTRKGTNSVSHVIVCEDCGCMLESGETGSNRGNKWNDRVISKPSDIETPKD